MLPKSIELYEEYGDDWVNHEECCGLFDRENVDRAEVHGILRKGTLIKVTRFEYDDDRYWGRLLMAWGEIEGGQFAGQEVRLRPVHQDTFDKLASPMIDPLELKVVPCPTE